MVQSIITKGKDIIAAIGAGLEILETTKDQVNIEVLQQESRGFLGIGAKNAIVKLTKVERTNASSAIDNLINDSLVEDILKAESEENTPNDYIPKETNDEDNLTGKVWIKDGRLFCKSSPDYFPMASVGSEVKLYKNGKHFSEKTVILSELDTYDIKVEDTEQPTVWNLSMDDLQLKVRLYVKPGYRIIRRVLDMDPSHHIEISAVEEKQVRNNIDYLDVMQKLEALRVSQGIKQTAILEALAAEEEGNFEVAAGKEAVIGKDGWVESKIDLEIKEGPKEREDGSVDYREIKTIPKVERGQVIGILHPPIPGEMGHTVTNIPIPPKPANPVIIKTGPGVALVDDKIVALESGRPYIETRGQLVRIKIVQKLTHPGNVDLTSGNLDFMGDIEIQGEVESNMSATAEGDILVQKTVTNASLTSQGAIVSYGHIIGSELSAGKNNMLVTELGHLLGILQIEVEKIITVIKQLEQASAFKSSDFSRGGIQPLIRILLEKKFKHFPPLVKKYIDAVRSGEKFLSEDSWRLVGVSLSQVFLSMNEVSSSMERIVELSKKMKEIHLLSQTEIEPDSYITIPSALNSRLYCSGNILILGKSCVNSKVHAGGVLKINGVLRGGEIYGRLGVEINEAGAESGTTTIIAVPRDQRISLNKVMEGTTIKVGNVKFTFTETRTNFVAHLDDNDRIVFR